MVLISMWGASFIDVADTDLSECTNVVLLIVRSQRFSQPIVFAANSVRSQRCSQPRVLGRERIHCREEHFDETIDVVFSSGVASERSNVLIFLLLRFRFWF